MQLSNELGILSVDQDVVIFSKDRLDEIAEELDMSTTSLIEKYEGVSCGFTSDGGYRIHRLHSVLTTGKVVETVVITGCANFEDFLRFLQDGEPTFYQFLKTHPKYDGNGSAYKEIAEEYRRMLISVP